MGATLGLATVAFAEPHHEGRWAHKAEKILEKHLEIVDSLELDADKSAELKALITSQHEERQAAWQAHHQQMKALRENQRGEVSEILTEEEQQALRKAMKKEFKKHRKEYRDY